MTACSVALVSVDMRRYSDLKKQTDRNYAARLRQQLANAEARVK
jgi:hypothetical protein